VERYLQGGDGAKRKQLHERFRLAVASQKNKDRDEWGSDNSGLNPGGMDAALRMYGEEGKYWDVPKSRTTVSPYKTDTFLKKLKVVAAVGDEVDRMEKNIVRVEPTIHYVDLETH
jgi:zinc transporter 9